MRSPAEINRQRPDGVWERLCKTPGCGWHERTEHFQASQKQLKSGRRETFFCIYCKVCNRGVARKYRKAREEDANFVIPVAKQGKRKLLPGEPIPAIPALVELLGVTLERPATRAGRADQCGHKPPVGARLGEW